MVHGLDDMSTLNDLSNPGVDPADEIKRLEKLYDISRELFNYSEGVIKTLDEKSRNSLTTVSAITAFAFVIQKPESLRFFTISNAIIFSIAVLVAIVYIMHLIIVMPQKSKAASALEIQKLESRTTVPEEVLFYNFQALLGIYERNIQLISDKNFYMSIQNIALGLAIVAALIHIGYNRSN